MTHQEAVLVSAYTGYLLTKDFSDVHKFCQDLVGFPIFTHSFADEELWETIRKKCKPLIVDMIKNESE